MPPKKPAGGTKRIKAQKPDIPAIYNRFLQLDEEYQKRFVCKPISATSSDPLLKRMVAFIISYTIPNDPDSLKKRIITFATAYDHYILATNPITNNVVLISEHMPLIRPFMHSARLIQMSKRIFWEQNTVVVRGVGEASKILICYKSEIRRLYLVWQHVEVGQVPLPLMIKEYLKDFERLEWLAVAFELPEKQKKMKAKESAEVGDVIEALDELNVKRKFVVIKQSGDEPGIDEVVRSDGGEVEEVVEELLGAGVGVGLHLY
ncbi:hypothetical protein LTR86_009664 [Recurvomyces mirabilis]|nr:hypothetical protein LTR86_009664 [Recurvomyces mirabilis]